ncbi:MAG: LCP family protein [Actinomycetota bacterium]
MRSRLPILVAVAVVTAALAGAFMSSSQAAPNDSDAPEVKVGKAHPEEAVHLRVLTDNRPIFVLAMGDNYREPFEKSHLTDSIHLIGINPAKKQASIVGFPRDSYVEIPGHGRSKINNAMAFGGPSLAVETVEHLTGIRINYYAVTTFEGFKTIVSGLKGLPVKIPYTINDKSSHARLKKGLQTLTGKEALAFARSRYDVPNGDFSRSENQGIILMAFLDKLRTQFERDPSSIFEFIGLGLHNANTDVPLDELLDLAFTVVEIQPNKVTNQVVPGSIATADGLSIVKISPAANKIYKTMKGDGLVGR